MAGISLATGLTVRRLGRGTKRAAGAVAAQAERSTLVLRGREAQTARADALTDAASRSPDGFRDLLAGGTVASVTTPYLGPRDMVGDGGLDGLAYGVPQGPGYAPAGGDPGFSGPFVGEFDDWMEGRTVARSPHAPLGSGDAGMGGAGVLDGAQAYADLYGGAAGSQMGVAGMAAVAGAGLGATGVADTAGGVTGQGGTGSAGAVWARRRHSGNGRLRQTRTAATSPETGTRKRCSQETLPGLARAPRQTTLAVEQPAYLLARTSSAAKSVPTVAAGQG